MQACLIFDGSTFIPLRDGKRLTGQFHRVWEVLCDEQWHTLREVSDRTGDPEASISARLRDFRKPRFGAHKVVREFRSQGLHVYKLEINYDNR